MNLLFILMDIRLLRCRCFVFPGLWVGYEAKDGNQTTHQRTDDVEEAEGEIDKLVFHLLCVFIRFFNAFLLCIRQESCYDAEQWQEGTHLEDELDARLVC